MYLVIERHERDRDISEVQWKRKTNDFAPVLSAIRSLRAVSLRSRNASEIIHWDVLSTLESKFTLIQVFTRVPLISCYLSPVTTLPCERTSTNNKQKRDRSQHDIYPTTFPQR